MCRRLTIFMFSRARNPFLTLLATKLPCLGDLEIPGQLPVQEVLAGRLLVIVSYRLSQFLHYFCFRGQGIHC